MAIRRRLVGGFLRGALGRLIRTLPRVLLYSVVGALVMTLLLVVPLRWVDPAGSAFMLQNLFAELGHERRDGVTVRHQWVPLEEIAPAMRLAAVAAEDQHFPYHRGFDTGAVREAVAEALRGGRLRGASTISQQVAKNLYLWHGRSLFRKGVEAWFTVFIELFWSKDRILEVYLNIAEWDAHLYGVEAASQHYFSKPAATLTPHEAALLAAVLPNPKRFRVDAPTAYVRQRQQWILRQMRSLGADHLEGQDTVGNLEKPVLGGWGPCKKLS